MDHDFLDFGSGSDSDDEQDVAMKGLMKDEIGDSDDDEKDDALVKLLSLPTSKRNKEKIDIDDFEAEMEAELDKRTIEAEKEGGMEHQRSLSRSSSSSSLSGASGRHSSMSDKPGSSNAPPGEGKSVQKKTVHFAVEPPPPGTTEAKDLYDAIYFDSDESEGEDDERKARKRSKRELLTDDDLFYDPNADEADQEWVNNKRRDYSSSSKSMSQEKPLKGSTNGEGNSGKKDERSSISRRQKQKPQLSRTDAVLNCPACFTALCLDCQRHEFYSGQYRAMFVMNCVIDKTETLIVPVKEPKSKKRDKSNLVKIETVKSVSESDKFFPVKCKICTTQVAVHDHDEVYHFFNVLASHP